MWEANLEAGRQQGKYCCDPSKKWWGPGPGSGNGEKRNEGFGGVGEKTDEYWHTQLRCVTLRKRQVGAWGGRGEQGRLRILLWSRAQFCVTLPPLHSCSCSVSYQHVNELIRNGNHSFNYILPSLEQSLTKARISVCCVLLVLIFPILRTVPSTEQTSYKNKLLFFMYLLCVRQCAEVLGRQMRWKYPNQGDHQADREFPRQCDPGPGRSRVSDTLSYVCWQLLCFCSWALLSGFGISVLSIGT